MKSFSSPVRKSSDTSPPFFLSHDVCISNELPECKEFCCTNWQRSNAKISPFVYSTVEKKQEKFLLLLETDQLKDLGLLGVAMNGTTITEI